MGIKKTDSRKSVSCAQDWIRTSTPVTAPPPQDGVSTNFTTWALRGQKYSFFCNFKP